MATTAAPPLTLEEFSRLPRDGNRHELSAGELITMPPPKSLHTLIAHAIFEALRIYLEERGAYKALIEAGYVLFHDPLTIRQPDVSVVSKDRLRAAQPESYFEGAPELAIEVVSPSDSAEDLELKVRQYFQTGGREVWVIYPKTKTVHVLSTTETAKILNEAETLESSALLPGFSVAVDSFFAQ